MCVCQPAAKAALAEIERLHPNRDTASDGCCSSSQHYTQNPGSDHDVGMAFDIDHDPANGVDCNALAALVLDDPRTKYVIWNRRIWSASKASQGWRSYTGSNPHDKHMHVSINAGQGGNTAPWFTGGADEVTDDDLAKLGAWEKDTRAEVIADVKAEIQKQTNQIDRFAVWQMRQAGVSDADIRRILGKSTLPAA